MRLLVTGTGRCGSTWLAGAISAAGVPCTHEMYWNYDRHGEGDWKAEVAWPAAPFTPLRDAYVVHLVRHPLATIRSRASWGTFDNDLEDMRRRARLGRWAMEVVPEIGQGRTPVERSAIHWVKWNLLVQGPQEVLRLEDITVDDITRLARIVDPAAVLERLPEPVNGAPKLLGDIDWEDVAHIPGLLELSVRYGYLA